ncbi:glycosyl transferase, partial [Prevotella melaninogenica]|nr:glycosyl transferase [Prevotella melaninogenica]
MNKISVYVPNLQERVDRKKSIMHQFKRRSEFILTIVPAIKNKIGAWGLWQTFIKIVEEENKKGSDFFILCEDDHVFTKNYSSQYLFENIVAADDREADLLFGG